MEIFSCKHSSFLRSSGGSGALHVGTTARDALDDGSTAATVVKRVSHPDFDRGTYAYDFVVLKLSGWVRLCGWNWWISAGDKISSKRLLSPQIDKDVVRLSSGSPSVGDSLTIVGFGLTTEDGKNSNKLLKAEVNYFDSEACASIFEGENEIIPEIMLCAEGSGVDA